MSSSNLPQDIGGSGAALIAVTDESTGVTAEVTTAGGLHVNLRDASGSEVSVGGGTQYDEDSVHVSGDKVTLAGVVRSDAGGALSGTDGDRTVLQVDANGALRVTGGGGGTEYTEDVAAAADPVGTTLIMVRADTLAAVTSADGDNIAVRGTNKGELYVKHADALTVTDVSTATKQDTVIGQLSTIFGVIDGIEGLLTTIDADTSTLSVVGGGVEATALRVTLASDSTGLVSVDDNGGSLTVDGTVTANLAAGANNIGDVDILSIAAGNNNIGDVDIASIAAGDNNIGNVDIVSLPASTNTLEVVGDAAHDAAAAGNPLLLGAKAETSLSGITAVADGDVTHLFAGVDGVLIVRKHSNLEDVVQERTTNTDGASTAFASGLAAPGANIRLWITNVDICNSSAAFCTVDLRDGSAGSVLWTLPVPATGGVVKNFDPPLKLTANTALAFDASAATTTLTISANGFKSKV